MKQNTDLNALSLAKILHFSGQFVDGRLAPIIAECLESAYGWKVDAAQLLVAQINGAR